VCPCFSLLWAAAVLGRALAFLPDAAAAEEAIKGTAILRIPLEAARASQGLSTTTLRFRPGAPVFKREPDFARHEVRRCILDLGAKDANFAVAWDRTAGRLYLDLNGNLDLTDDPGGQYRASSNGFRQTFPDVQLPRRANARAGSLIADLTLYDYGAMVGGSAVVHTYWRGRADFSGEDCEVGLVEAWPGGQSPAQMLLRAWSQRTEPWDPANGGLAGFEMPARLFLRHGLYRVEPRFESEGGTGKWFLDCTGEPCETGKLNLTGRSIDRLILRQRNTAVVLDRPGTELQVPLGDYVRADVRLAAAGVAAAPARPGVGKPFAVRAGTPAVLALGGPLTNVVGVSQRGRTLVFSYRLIGAEGTEYRLAGAPGVQPPPPRFKVYAGSAEVAAGKFEYG
jgi:hypothetical protein